MVITMDGFRSADELYKKVEPALNSKRKDLTRVGINYVQKVDIWNYLKNNVWNKKVNLTLGEIVNDIMTTSNGELENYVQDLMTNTPRVRIEDNLL